MKLRRALWLLCGPSLLALSALACDRSGAAAPVPTPPGATPTSAIVAVLPDASGEPAAVPGAQGAAASCEIVEEAAGPNPYIHAEGTRLKDGDGQDITLRGVNLGGWLHWEGWIWGGGLNGETKIRDELAGLVGQSSLEAFQQEIYRRFITEADIARIAELGFNVVRVPVNHRLLEDDAAPYVYKESGWEILDALLSWGEKHGVYVVLTLHSAPAGQSALFTADPEDTLLWEDEEAQRRTAALWQAIAGRYHDRAIIAGYDLLNEPDPPQPGQLVSFFSCLVAAIRQVDPWHLLILEGGDFGRDFSMYDGPLSANQAYSFHMYTWFGDNRQEFLDKYRAVAQSQGVPMWAGEFGENNYEMIQSTLAMFEAPENDVAGWAFWTWKKAPNRYPYLLGIVDAPDGWQAVMDWVEWPNWPSEEPSAEAAQAAMTAFLDAAGGPAVVEDERMIAILTREGE